VTTECRRNLVLPMQAEQTNPCAAPRRHHLRNAAAAHLGIVLIQNDIADPVALVLNVPVRTLQRQQNIRICLRIRLRSSKRFWNVGNSGAGSDAEHCCGVSRGSGVPVAVGLAPQPQRDGRHEPKATDASGSLLFRYSLFRVRNRLLVRSAGHIELDLIEIERDLFRRKFAAMPVTAVSEKPYQDAL